MSRGRILATIRAFAATMARNAPTVKAETAGIHRVSCQVGPFDPSTSYDDAHN